MKIQECFVENFGGLHAYHFCPKEGFQYVYADNGSGKTTFAAFVKAMFYGLSGSRARKNLEEAERKKYKPWQGGVWGGFICFTAGEKSYRLERTFGDKEKDDTFCLTDLRTGLVSQDYSENIGQELFGVNKASYMATAFISWNRMQVEVNDSMTIRLGNMTDDAGIKNCEKAVAALEEEYKEYVKTGNRGRIAEMERKITSLSMQQWELTEAKKKKEQEVQQGNRSEKQGQKLMLSQKEQEQLVFLDDYFGAGIPDLEELERVSYTAQQELDLQQIQQKRLGRQQKRRKTAAVAAVFLAVGFGVAGVFSMPIFWIVALFCIGAAGILLAGVYRGKKTQKEQGTRQQLCEQAVQQAKERVAYARVYKSLSEKEGIYKAARNEVCAQQEKNRIEAAVKEREQLGQKLLAVTKELQSSKEEQARLVHRAEVLAKTKEYLLAARQDYTQHLLQAVSGTFYRYLAVFDASLAEKVTMDASYGIKVLENGIYREMDYYSSGIKDIIWFCERMAFAEKLFLTDRPVMILDDIFLALDNKMRKKAFAMLEKISQEFQIIYLSCHETVTEI